MSEQTDYLQCWPDSRRRCVAAVYYQLADRRSARLVGQTLTQR